MSSKSSSPDYNLDYQVNQKIMSEEYQASKKRKIRIPKFKKNPNPKKIITHELDDQDTISELKGLTEKKIKSTNTETSKFI